MQKGSFFLLRVMWAKSCFLAHHWGLQAFPSCMKIGIGSAKEPRVLKLEALGFKRHKSQHRKCQSRLRQKSERTCRAQFQNPRTPEPQTINPKPKTPNPKPCTPKDSAKSGPLCSLVFTRWSRLEPCGSCLWDQESWRVWLALLASWVLCLGVQGFGVWSSGF